MTRPSPSTRNMRQHTSIGASLTTTWASWRQAIADYDQAIALDPQYVAHTSIGASLTTTWAIWRQAIADYDQAIALDPQNALAYNNRGIAYRDLGDLEQAIADYDQAIALDPQYAALTTIGGSFTKTWESWSKPLSTTNATWNLPPTRQTVLN
jgi:tetratricopeptide (TPR) repeat protein